MNICELLKILMDVIDRRDRAMNGENIDLNDRNRVNIFCLRAKL